MGAILHQVKGTVLSLAERSGFSRRLQNSGWRQKRLLILSYHGVALEDEHIWNPSLYVEASVLRDRLAHLRDAAYNVIGLGEAVERLYDGSLPARSVVLTFDDGFYDFYRAAYPIVREFGYPATVYLTTYYSEFNRPVFDPALSYLFWKGRGKKLAFPPVWEETLTLDDQSRLEAWRRVRTFAAARDLSGREKDRLLASLAERLDIDYESLCRARILHIMTPAEAREVAAGGVSLELHMHAHRVSRNKDAFMHEIEENRRRVRSLSNAEPYHFCYPSGFVLPVFQDWLREAGVRSATTCEPGICTARSSRWLLPRFVDSNSNTMLDFASWATGVRTLFPQRGHEMGEGRLIEEE